MSTRPKYSDELVKRIRELVRWIASDPDSFGVLSTGEKCAVALVLDDPVLMKWYGTALDCVNRIDDGFGEDWLAACYRVQRDGWDP